MQNKKEFYDIENPLYTDRFKSFRFKIIIKIYFEFKTKEHFAACFCVDIFIIPKFFFFALLCRLLFQNFIVLLNVRCS